MRIKRIRIVMDAGKVSQGSGFGNRWWVWR
jgi:hypothetical protein